MVGSAILTAISREFPAPGAGLTCPNSNPDPTKAVTRTLVMATRRIMDVSIAVLLDWCCSQLYHQFQRCQSMPEVMFADKTPVHRRVGGVGSAGVVPTQAGRPLPRAGGQAGLGRVEAIARRPRCRSSRDFSRSGGDG